MKYAVICLDTGDPVEGEVFDTGQRAAERAAYLSARLGKKHQPRPVPEDDGNWKVREKQRLLDGTYIPVPWHKESWVARITQCEHHYPHVSKKKAGLMAYTQDAMKGMLDCQTALRPGVYLSRYYPGLGGTLIQEWTSRFAAEHGAGIVKFTQDPDVIEQVYNNGPESCMSYNAENFSSREHPVRVYGGGPDLALAYMEEADGGISARALCWPEKKIFGRIYGDEVRLNCAMQALGYQFGYLNGARFQKVVYEKRRNRTVYVVPYIDHVGAARVDGDYLVFDKQGSICGTNTNGLSSGGYACTSCGEHIHANETREWNGEFYCEECLDAITWSCDGCGYRYSDDDDSTTDVHCRSGRITTWCDSCVESYAFTCEATNEVWHCDYRVTLADGTEWSQDYYRAHGGCCTGCHDSYPSDALTALDGDKYCEECLPTPGEEKPVKKRKTTRK